MLKRFFIPVISFLAVISILTIRIDLVAASCQNDLDDKISFHEMSMTPKDVNPFGKFDPRSKTPTHVVRSAGFSYTPAIKKNEVKYFLTEASYSLEVRHSFVNLYDSRLQEKKIILYQIFRI